MVKTVRFRAVLALLLAVYAHVKWFSDFSFSDPPLPLNEAVTLAFIALVLLDDRLKEVEWYRRFVGTRYYRVCCLTTLKRLAPCPIYPTHSAYT